VCVLCVCVSVCVLCVCCVCCELCVCVCCVCVCEWRHTQEKLCVRTHTTRCLCTIPDSMMGTHTSTCILDVCESDNKLFPTISAAPRTQNSRNNFLEVTNERTVCISSGLCECLWCMCSVCVYWVCVYLWPTYTHDYYKP